MLKKLISFLVLAFMLTSPLSAFAGTYSSGYNSPILYEDFQFTAERDGTTVYMSWKPFLKDVNFKYYKVIRSSTNENPVYPDHGYIKYSSDRNFTEYKDYNAPKWTQFYRICAMTHDNNRYCSNVEKVYIEYTETPTVCTMEYAPVCWKNTSWEYKTYSNKCMLNAAGAYYKYAWECQNTTEVKPVEKSWLSYTLKIRSQNLVINLFKRLDSTSLTNEEKLNKINIIIEKLNNLKSTKPRLVDLINYLVLLLEEKKIKYEDDFTEIEAIFWE